MTRINELAQMIQVWDIKEGQTPQAWLDEYSNLWAEQVREDNAKKEAKSKEMRNRRRRGKYGEKKLAKEVGGRRDGGVGRKDVTSGGIFNYEIKTIKKLPASIIKIMAQAERLKKKGTIAVGVFRCNSPRQEFFILDRNDWLELHGKEKK